MSGARLQASELRFALGVAGLVLSGLPVDDRSIGPREVSWFRAVNRLPDGLYPPLWVVMQAGNAAAAQVAGIGAAATGRRRLAIRLVIGGSVTWVLAKLVKRIYRRPRPAALVADARCRGPEPSGLGYVSGHAGIATVIAVAVGPELPRPLLAAALPPVVGLTRVYVGAHLPLDVVGGAALGLAVDALVDRLLSPAGVAHADVERHASRSGTRAPSRSSAPE